MHLEISISSDEKNGLNHDLETTKHKTSAQRLYFCRLLNIPYG